MWQCFLRVCACVSAFGHMCACVRTCVCVRNASACVRLQYPSPTSTCITHQDWHGLAHCSHVLQIWIMCALCANTCGLSVIKINLGCLIMHTYKSVSVCVCVFMCMSIHMDIGSDNPRLILIRKQDHPEGINALFNNIFLCDFLCFFFFGFSFKGSLTKTSYSRFIGTQLWNEPSDR